MYQPNSGHEFVPIDKEYAQKMWVYAILKNGGILRIGRICLQIKPMDEDGMFELTWGLPAQNYVFRPTINKRSSAPKVIKEIAKKPTQTALDDIRTTNTGTFEL